MEHLQREGVNVFHEPELACILGNEFHKKVFEFEQKHGLVKSLQQLKDLI